MQNQGKQFEKDFIKSVPDTVFHYRFKDGTAGFAGAQNENVRFQAKNICDFQLFDGRLILLELKSHKGKSIPFSCIRENQLSELSKAEIYPGIIPGIVFNFRDMGKTYFVRINHVWGYIKNSDRKSIPLEFVQQYGIEIKGTLKKVHYRYDIKSFLEAI